MPEYRNPQNEPGMERNVLLLFVFMFVAIIGSELLMKKYAPPPQTTSATQPASPVQPAPSSPSAIPSPPPAASSGKPAASAAVKQASSESQIVVENNLYRITFTNRGAQVKSWVLKNFQDDHGQPLDLVNAANSARYGYPLSLWTYDPNLRNQLNSALYVPGTTAPSLNVPGDLAFDYSDPSGLTVRKTFHFDDTYVIGVDASVYSNGSPVWAFPSWPAGFGDQTNVPAYASGQFEYQFNNNTEHIAFKKVSGGATLTGSYNWAGISSQYFAAVFIPENPQDLRVITLRNSVDAAASASNAEIKPADALGVAAGRPGESSERLFAGPKSFNVLDSISVPTIVGADKDLRGVVNFGLYGIIARPLFTWPYIGLRWYYKFVHNWGWAIVIQTFIITLALLPLRIKQMHWSLKMQKIQPQIKAIQEKYKKYSMRDPRKQDMQKEIFDLQKREGVNQLGGCLPMLVQLPFLFAYYRMLSAAIELRQAHWLWIRDLSSSDIVLPLLMAFSMFLVQRMTPQPGIDPAQQRMMNFVMPVMMGFLFFRLPAGLNLYYAESNFISIVQQWLMNRTKLGREMREIAAKRARKKDK